MVHKLFVRFRSTPALAMRHSLQFQQTSPIRPRPQQHIMTSPLLQDLDWPSTGCSEDSTRSAHITLLPTELILAILDAISAIDTVCLMLTCQHFHRLAADFSSLARKINKQHGKDAILAQFERGLEDKFYCRRDYRVTRYWRLSTHEPGASPHACLHDCALLPSRHHDDHDVSFMYSMAQYSVSRCNAVLVTNYHFTERKHGVEPSVLGYACERWLPQVKLHARESWKATVMPATGELVVSCTRIYSAEQGYGTSGLRRLFAVNQPSWTGSIAGQHTAICRHIHHFARALLLSTFPPLTVDGSARFGVAARCERCHTHGTAEYRQRGLTSDGGTGEGDDRLGPVVVIKTLHNLGDFRSPTNPKWLAMKAMSV